MDSLYCGRSFWLEDKKMRTHQDIVNEIEKILKDKVKPSVAAHGSCSGCAMSKVTLHRGVENMLKHYIPEVQSIIGEDDKEAKEQGYTPYFPKDKEPDWEKVARHTY
jgi:Fe-S cluster biogenesis protein NfuA